MEEERKIVPRKRELLDSDEDDEGRGPGRGSDGTPFLLKTPCCSPVLLYRCFLRLPVVSTAAELGTPVIHKKKRFQIEDDDDDD